jgi:hypothetical protein
MNDGIMYSGCPSEGLGWADWENKTFGSELIRPFRPAKQWIYPELHRVRMFGHKFELRFFVIARQGLHPDHLWDA